MSAERPDRTQQTWPDSLDQSWSDPVRRDPTGNVTMDTRGMERPEVNAPMWQEALPPHTVENVVSQQMIAVAVEIKIAV